jgi:signal transduction histidine kinase
MPIVESEFVATRDPRLAAELSERAFSNAPVWLWSTDGSRILWANAVGAAIFGAANASECATLRFDSKHAVALEVARLAATLPQSGQTRLERLRGFGASFGRALPCVCSRVSLDDGAAVLVAAAESAGPPLTLRERVSRVMTQREKPLALFAPDGQLLYATQTAQARLNGAPGLPALGLADAASQALADGAARATTSQGSVSLERLGSDASTVLAAEFGAPFAEAHPAAEVSSPAPAATATPPQASPKLNHAEPAERRHPLRFVWQMDASGHFVIGSDEFVELMGPRTSAAFGRIWSEIAAALKLDPHDEVARAVATGETWSGIIVSWPVDDGGERLPVEMSGLPVFDRERKLRGYRGFGVCRDIGHINELVRTRRERPIGFMPPPEKPPESEIAPAITASVPAAAAAIVTPPTTEPAAAAAPAAGPVAPSVAPAPNVVPFRPGGPEPKAPSLSPVERKAFRDLAQELTARLQGSREADGDAAAAAETVAAEADPSAPTTPIAFEPILLDRIPLAALIYRHDALLYANRHFLELSGYRSLGALAAAGGLNALFAEREADGLARDGGAQPVLIGTGDGGRRPVEGRLFSIPWGDGAAMALILSDGVTAERRQSAAFAETEIRELKARLDSFAKGEEEMRAATREAQRAAAAKAEFVGKVSHEIRTPLNTITGFAEVIADERFGPLGNERYRDYVKDIHAAGMHLVSLLNDLLDLSKIETGQLDLTFANVSLNDLTQQCVGIMQPEASRARIIIRTSLTPGLPQVVADERSLRQIVLNLLSNSIRFTGPGGQVIVSTARADSGEAVLRVRDTGVGMSEKDVEAALEPFRQTATAASSGSGGTGLGLPLTKALAEANRVHFSIKSAPNAGTLIEVAFPRTRVAH